jgi:hypothetical protein
MITLIYVTIAVAFLILILGLLTRTRSEETNGSIIDKDHRAPYLGNARSLDLSERIFDPSDARWLREDLAFPVLADSLAGARKQLALHWLKALQASFKDLVRSPELVPGEAPGADSMMSWRMLWLTVRFQLLLSYALVVVRLFGPYHRLIPSFTWVRFPHTYDSRLRSPIFVDYKDLT